MFKKIALAGLGISAALVAAFVAVVEMQPGHMHIERSTTIVAPAEVIEPRIADFHRWAEWSPWVKLDPTMARTFDGPASGKGESYAWKGNKDVGEGKMTIVDADTSHVSIDLQFIAPMAGSNPTLFTLAPATDGTKVTWAMDADCNFMAKAAGMFMDMDKMIGPDFEHGLADLKSASEAEQAQHVADAATAAAAAAATPVADAGAPAVGTPPAKP